MRALNPVTLAESLPNKPRSRATLVAPVSLVAILTLLTACAVLGPLIDYRAGVAAQHATDLGNAYDEIRYYLLAEREEQEAYWLQPGPEARRRFDEASLSLSKSLARIRSLEPNANVPLDLAVAQAKYLSATERAFSAVDLSDDE